MRQRISGANALVLHTETQTTPAHLLVVFTLEAAEHLSHARLHELAGSSLPGLAKFRSRLVGKPLGLGQPLWAEVEDLDLADHLHRVAVAPPGGRSEFADLVAKLLSRPLDRDKPLWQVWTVEGLEHDRWALVLKISPCMVDGAEGMAAVLERLLTASPGDNPTTYVPVEAGLGPAPSIVDLVGETAKELAANQLAGLRLAGGAVPEVLRAAVLRLLGPEGDGEPVPRTVFNEPLTKRREVAFASVPAADVEFVKDAFDVSTDDVFLAACTLSLRTWFLRRNTLPAHPLVLQMSMAATSGRVRLPIQRDDPVDLLHRLHTQTQRIQVAHRSNSENSPAATTLPTIAQLVPPNLVTTGMRVYSGLALSRRLAPSVHGVAARISGPPVQMYCAGARVAGIHIVPALLEGAGLALTSTWHDDVMDVTVNVCPERVAGVEEIADGIVEAVGKIYRVGKKKHPPMPP